MKISIDDASCQGHGRCYEIAEELVEDDERGHAVLLLADVPFNLEAKAQAAINACPERAISTVE